MPPLPTRATPQARHEDRILLEEALTQQQVVERARRDLAERLDLPLAEVKVVRVSELRPAPSPGPPGKVPDRAYPDDPYPGRLPTYRILLSAGGGLYEYEVYGRWLLFGGCVGGETRIPGAAT
jgi:hypothetical protein